MRRFDGLEAVTGLQNPVVAVGSFDGVHQGHRRILQRLLDIARLCEGSSVVVTFDPHPREVLCQGHSFFRINPLERNLELIEQQNVDAVVVIPFTEKFAQTSCESFIESVVVRHLHAHTLVMGPHHAVGHNREGNNETIVQLCQRFGVQTVEIPELLYKEAGVHSAKIRQSILDGDFETAEALLGYPYRLRPACSLDK